MKKLSQAIVLAGAMTAGLAAVNTAQAADVEISASAGVSNMYLWRGTDLGQGSAMVDGSLDVAMGGLYGGVWIGSGDSGAGQEYDLYVGYAGEAGDFSYDISAVTYTYPGESLEDGDREGNTFELSEYVIGLGYMGASFSYTAPLADDGQGDYQYITLGYGVGAFSGVIGYNDQDTDYVAKGDYTHVDLTYAMTDNLSFTASKIVDMENDDAWDDDMRFAFYYSLPIEM